MPKKKAIVLKRAKVVAKVREKRWPNGEEAEAAGDNQPSGLPSSPPSPPSPLSNNNPSGEDGPEHLATGLGGLTLENTLNHEDDIVLEDPPVYEEDPPEAINPPSLADPECYEDVPPDELEPSVEESSEDKEIIEDEDLSSELQDWLRAKGKYVQARDIIDFFEAPEALPFLRVVEGPPSLRTAQRWMHRMGYTWKTERRGQFADGHERDDVVEYRMKYYVPEWLKLEKRMRSWDAKGNEIPPKLNEGERTVVVWFHDESTFYAHDHQLTRWIHESETAAIYKKGEGISLMVADFVSADYGWLRLGSGPPNDLSSEGSGADSAAKGEDFTDARVIFRAGKNRDGWFGMADVVKQLLRAMSIIKRRYPNEDHVFVFDNATIHTKLPETTPNVNKLTLGPSQKVGGEGISVVRTGE
ncbi:hypothetical protein RSOL_456980, partial [Rhizoctonia solani AG-3 Rhs1AP]